MPKFVSDPIIDTRILPLATAVAGQMYFNTNTKTLMIFDGYLWVALGDDLMEWMG